MRWSTSRPTTTTTRRWNTLPSVAKAGAHAYAGWGLRDLCDALHACYRDNDTAAAMNAMYTELPSPR